MSSGRLRVRVGSLRKLDAWQVNPDPSTIAISPNYSNKVCFAPRPWCRSFVTNVVLPPRIWILHHPTKEFGRRSRSSRYGCQTHSTLQRCVFVFHSLVTACMSNRPPRTFTTLLRLHVYRVA